MNKSQHCKVIDYHFIDRLLKLKIKDLKSLIHRKTSTFHPSLNCNGFPVFPFLFKQIIKDFHCCLTVSCGKFKAVVQELFNRVHLEVLQVVVKPFVGEIVHTKPSSLNAS